VFSDTRNAKRPVLARTGDEMIVAAILIIDDQPTDREYLATLLADSA
jgi:hypothetical protein